MLFEKQPQLHCQTSFSSGDMMETRLTVLASNFAGRYLANQVLNCLVLCFIFFAW